MFSKKSGEDVVREYMDMLTGKICGKIRTEDGFIIIVPFPAFREECFTTLDEMMSDFSLGECEILNMKNEESTSYARLDFISSEVASSVFFK